MTQEDYLPEEVDIYISYTRRAKEDKDIAEAFYSACKRHPKLRPHIDRNLRDGEKIYQYMDELSAARFVVCVFSADYFKSENCVYEFAGLCDNGYMPDRIFPLFQEHCFADKQRKEWMTALVDEKELKQRVKDKTGRDLAELTEKVRWQAMDKLAGVVVPLASEHKKDDFAKFIDNFLIKIAEDNKEKFCDHEKYLVCEVKKILGKDSLQELLPELGHELQCEKNKEECSGALFTDIVTGVDKLSRAAKKMNFNVKTNRDLQEIVGILLVSTVNPGWWLMNEFRIEHERKTGKGINADEMVEHEIEIVFARMFKRPEMYKVVGEKYKSESFTGKWNGCIFVTMR